jgi:uncharacterized repeat protein (TIGR02543 family)
MSYWGGENYADNIAGYNVPYFSNPGVTHEGQPTGHVTRADAARSLRETKHTVAFYSDKIADLLDAPVNFKINSVSCNGFSASWSPVNGASSYHFCFRRSDASSMSWSYYDNITSASFTINSNPAYFVTGVEYTCWVIVINACGDGTKSAEITFTPACATTVTSVSVSPSTASVVKGGTQSFSANVTGTGNLAVSWSVSGNNSASTTISSSGLLTIASNETATSLTVKATSMDPSKYGTATVTVTAPAPTTYTITATDDAHSAITPYGSVTVNANASQIFNWSFDNGYEKNQLKVDNAVTNVSGTSYQFANVTSIHTIGITSKATTYTITYNLNGGSGANNSSYTIESATITLPTPTRSGNTFQGWYGNVSLTGNAVTVIPAGSTGDKIFYAKWEVIAPPTYRLTVNNGRGGGNYASGTVVYVSANTPPNGQVFDSWTVDVYGIADINAASTTFTMGTSAATVTAAYKPDIIDGNETVEPSNVKVYGVRTSLVAESDVAIKSVAVYNLLGHVVRHEQVNSTGVRIDNLPKGILIVAVTLQGEKIEIRKVFIY